MSRVAVLDFEMGNLRSVAKALERAGASVEVTAEVPRSADALVVPGQGAFGSCLVNLGERRHDIGKWIAEGRPYLGICLGLQILFLASEEGGGPGLEILEGKVVRFADGVKVPHIGWNEVDTKGAAPLFAGIPAGERFYFCHSYYPETEPSVVSATSDYGSEFCCAVWRDNVHAVQFHPEKSGDAGLAMLRNFLDVVGGA